MSARDILTAMDDLKFSVQLARDTGQLLLEHFNPHGSSSKLKSDQSVITEADLAADRLIADAIQKNYPDDSLISEELRPLYDPAETDQPDGVWVVDPLDGTTNFSLGLPIWGISIARLVNGWPDIGVLYFPIFDELYSARRGSGARLNGEPLHVSPLNKNSKTSFFSSCSRTYRLYEVGIRFKPRILGSAAYTFCAVARGIAILGFEATPKIWDIAAGWLLVTEARGSVAGFDPQDQPFPLVAKEDYRQKIYPTIIAASSHLLNTARQQLKPKSEQ
ncbi:MAG: inositol monophosphatase family protein [Anaerolineales bacterium]